MKSLIPNNMDTFYIILTAIAIILIVEPKAFGVIGLLLLIVIWCILGLVQLVTPGAYKPWVLDRLDQVMDTYDWLTSKMKK